MATKIVRHPEFLFILLSILTTALPASASVKKQPTIRVVVQKGAESLIVSMKRGYQIVDPSTAQEVDTGRVLNHIAIKPFEGGLQIGNKRFPQRQLRLIPKKFIDVEIDKKKYRFRGTLDIIVDKEQKLLVINTLGLEEYIKGVLYHETSDRWPMEALKAQAVAVRTYALYQVQVNKTQEYDLTNDVYSQVYGGRGSERYRTNIAVYRTQGEILQYKGEILPAYYHSNCGGHTEDAKNLWEHNLPSLQAKSCLFCQNAPHYHWKKNFRLKDIQDQLNKHGYPTGLIKDISVVDRNPSGRIQTLQIQTRDGKTFFISGVDFRGMIGPNEVKSNNYEIIMKGYYVDFIGKGWGHGVGLCQWGAYGMARQRFLYKEILQYYYPETEIVPYIP